MQLQSLTATRTKPSAQNKHHEKSIHTSGNKIIPEYEV